MTQTEWDNGIIEGPEPALYVVKSALNLAFTPEGRLITPLEFRIAGNGQIFTDTLATCFLTANGSEKAATLMPTGTYS